MPEVFVHDTTLVTCCGLRSVIKTQIYTFLSFSITVSKIACYEHLLFCWVTF